MEQNPQSQPTPTRPKTNLFLAAHPKTGLLKTLSALGRGGVLVLFWGEGVVAAGLESGAEVLAAPISDVTGGDMREGLADSFLAAVSDDGAEGEDHLRHSVGAV